MYVEDSEVEKEKSAMEKETKGREEGKWSLWKTVTKMFRNYPFIYLFFPMKMWPVLFEFPHENVTGIIWLVV